MTDSEEPKIVFWIEAGQGIGMGHLCRSLVIAREFLKFGLPSLFVINDDSAARDRLNAEGFHFETGGLSNDILPLVLNKTPQTVFFDTRKDITPLIQVLKRQRHKIILLDNTTPARFVTDIAIYPSALYDDKLEWSGFKGHVYGGAQYVPVAETYRKARGECQRLRHQSPYRILVTMGGSDPRRLTSEIVTSLHCLSEHIDIRVVIGPAFIPDPCLDEIEKGNAPRIQFIRNQNDLSSLMADSHMAVTAVGITLYELAVVGVPAIIIANFTEDRRDMELYKKLGMNLPLGFYQDILPSHIREATSRLIQDAAAWQSMRNKGWQLIDAYGARRIVECVLENA